ncbi:MAG: YdiU family protein, partial [Planctomycetes bacterium]|nr:YdiU family protein [Planctomycetota bacterium]
VLNTDNMNISGESFDYGPWRWLPAWDPEFTAAYFDHTGLYAFGRQAETLSWNCAQLAIALRPLVEAGPLVAALERFGPLYQENLARRFLWRLGVNPLSEERDLALVSTAERLMRETRASPDRFFFTHHGGRGADGELAQALDGFAPIERTHAYWAGNQPESLVIDEVEAIWDAIDQRDDWSVLEAKVAAIRRMGDALGEPPAPRGHHTE